MTKAGTKVSASSAARMTPSDDRSDAAFLATVEKLYASLAPFRAIGTPATRESSQ